jgi:hypothetical protein
MNRLRQQTPGGYDALYNTPAPGTAAACRDAIAAISKVLAYHLRACGDG